MKRDNTLYDISIPKEENNKLRNEIFLLKVENNKLRNETRILKEEINKLRNETTILKEEISEYKNETRILKEENNEYKNETRISNEEKNKLKIDLKKANLEIKKMLELEDKGIQKINTNEIILELKKILKIKELEIIQLKNKLENSKKEDSKKLVDFNDIMVIYFTSTDQKIIKHGIKCLKTDSFAEVEEKLYQEFEEYKLRDTNNIFIANGGYILRFKKLYENKLKNGDHIQLEIPE